MKSVPSGSRESGPKPPYSENSKVKETTLTRRDHLPFLKARWPPSFKILDPSLDHPPDTKKENRIWSPRSIIFECNNRLLFFTSLVCIFGN